jgi:hypothetical protein
MQLAFKNKAKDEYFVVNYLSKEYSDNWVPDVPEGDPNFDHGDQQEILPVSTSKTWKLDLEVPYNWTNLEGDFLNAWNSRADIIATGWAPYGDADVQNIDEASITFSADGRGRHYTGRRIHRSRNLYTGRRDEHHCVRGHFAEYPDCQLGKRNDNG